MPSRPSVTGTIELELPEFDAPPADPMPLLVSWADTAERVGVREPYNVALATSDAAGNPTNRMVLAKSFDLNGMTFATNSGSLKGHQLADRPHAAGEGLRWIAHGFSKLNLSDHELLDREFIIYDALYAECKERSASHETK